MAERVSGHLTVGPYLYRSLDRSYRDLLDERIARLEADVLRLRDRLAMLREERKRLGDRE